MYIFKKFKLSKDVRKDLGKQKAEGKKQKAKNK